MPKWTRIGGHSNLTPLLGAHKSVNAYLTFAQHPALFEIQIHELRMKY